MIIFLSDLHVSDETAGPHNISEGAYRGTFETLNQMATDAQAKDVTVVMLGDVFDLIRTNRWSQVDDEFKPWGGRDSEWVAAEILEKVLADSAFKYLGQFQFTNTESKEPIPTKWVYLPGNHDRLVGIYPSLREKVKQYLSLGRDSFQDDEMTSFIRYYHDEKHQAFARHGHEFDVYNYGGNKPFDAETWEDIDDDDYFNTPIGDVIAAEFASALPDAVQASLESKGLTPSSELYDRLRDLFDLRPMAAIPDFLAYHVGNEEDKDVRDAIMEGIRSRVAYLRENELVKQWIEDHGHWFNLLKAGGQINAVMKLIEHVDLDFVESVVPLVETGAKFVKKSDNFLSDAALEYKRIDSGPFASTDKAKGVLHVLYGHTHAPDQELVDVTSPDLQGRPRLYLNTGMWRPAQHAGKICGFTSIKHINCTIIYKPEERPTRNSKPRTYPTFEVWTGALKDD